MSALGSRVAAWWSSSRRVMALRLLAKASKVLLGALVVDTLASALLPMVVLVALGVMVGRIPPAVHHGWGSASGHRLLVSLVFVGASFAVAMLTAPFHQALSAAMKVRMTYAMQARLMAAVSSPVGIAHLEDPRVLDRLALAQGTLMTFWPADAPGMLSVVVGYRLSWLVGSVIVGAFRWWLGVALVVLWAWSRRPILKVIADHVAALGGNADVMRRAFYFQQLATRPPAAKELRIFGLGGWAVGSFRAHWKQGMAEVWRLRAGMHRTFAWVGVVIIGAYVGTCGVIGWAAFHHEIGLRTVAILLPVLALTMLGGCVSYEDISLVWQLSALPALDELEAEFATRIDGLDGTAPADGLPTREIRFERVGFAYPGSRPGSHVFDGLDLVLAAGRSTAIVGANGAGKTTLVKLLARLHDPTVGSMLVDGRPLADLDPRAWQRQVACVFQDFTHFPFTAADNVGVGAVAHLDDRDGIVRAATRAGAQTMIDELPCAWDTVLSRQFAGGADLSGGQWQRVALARALFAASHGAKVLVLDEPTSSLDVRGEAAFFENFLSLTAGVTTVIISHRFSTVRLADHICVLDGGTVTEQGTHADLVAAGGRYAHMFSLQAARFADATGDTGPHADNDGTGDGQ